MIICCGEALIDMLPRETPAGEAAFAPYAGGAVFNTAIALGRLGSQVQFFSGLSSDLFGEQLRTVLADSKVDSSPSHISDRPTTLAFVRLLNGHATYAFYDENTAGRMLTAADLPDITADALFFGGISLVVEPCGEAYKALMLREAPTKLTLSDPNIRPGCIKDEAAYRARLSAMLAVATLVIEEVDGTVTMAPPSDRFWLESVMKPVASALATPCSPVTAGVSPLRTADRKASNSARSGSSWPTGRCRIE